MTDLLFFYDTETTGLPVWKEPSSSDSQPHIVQLAGLLVDSVSRDIIQIMSVIVKPDGWEIPEETTKIHGITTEHAMQVGIPESLAVSLLVSMCGNYTRVGYNQPFDARILRIGIKRFMSDDEADQWKARSSECAMQKARPIVKMPNTNGRAGTKSPKLVEAYQHFMGEPMPGAHDAMVDTVGCMKVYFAIIDSE